MPVFQSKNISNYLNLRGVKCPMNYIKIKLFLDKLMVNSQLYVVIDLGEAIESVRQSIKIDGYELLAHKEYNSYGILTIFKGE